MLNLVLFGPPGAGKGTQSFKLIEKYQLIHLSTGDILRGEIATGSELGKEARRFMDKGELVPDNVVIQMIDKKLETNKDAKGFVFDGFPRTNAQAGALDSLLTKHNSAITSMITLDVEYDELVNRLLTRGKDSGRPDDQDINIIENRVNVYNKETKPVIDFYKKQNKFKAVQGMGTVDDIFSRLTETIDSL